MSLVKLKKEQLKLIAEELSLSFSPNAKSAELKELIENSDIFKKDKEFVQTVIDSTVEEKNKKSDDEIKLELERIKLAQLDKQLELAKLQKESGNNSSFPLDSVCDNSIEALIKSVKTLTIPVPSRVESYNLFFQSLEKAFHLKNVLESQKSEILLNILGDRVKNLLVHVSEKELSDYGKLKDLILKEFSPTPQDCLNKFQKAQKISSESYVQFASRLNANFEYYCQLRKVKDFKSLCELIVSDKIMSTLDKELMTHISVKQGESYFKPNELGRECDIYSSSRGKNKNETFISKPFSGYNKRFDSNKNRDNNFRQPKGATNVFLSEIKSNKCVLCGSNETHALEFCPKFRSLSVDERVECVKINKLCFKCLNPFCSVKTCKNRNCYCGKTHNKLLHFPREIKNRQCSRSAPDQIISNSVLNGNAESFVPRAEENIISNPLVATACIKNKCLLSTALIQVKNKFGEWITCRAICDSGSETCLITDECVNKLQLKCEKINTLISGLNDTSMSVSGCVKLEIANQDKSFKRVIEMLSVKKITDLIPNKQVELEVDLSKFVELADETFCKPGKIEMLLGVNIF